MAGILTRKLIAYKMALLKVEHNKLRDGKYNPALLHKVDRCWSELLKLVAELEKDDVEQYPERDIMKQLSEFQNTETVQIVAPGLLGKNHYGELDPDLLTIVVNKSIELSIKKDIWIVCDWKQSLECGWFTKGIADHADIACILAGLFADTYPDAKWVFGFGPLQRPEEIGFKPIEGFLRYGTTVAGCALQLAYWLDAKTIVLCGADFQGDKYFDGTGRGLPVSQLTKKFVPDMNRLIAWIIAKGVKIKSLSKTSLKL